MRATSDFGGIDQPKSKIQNLKEERNENNTDD
jgi:hypothetical protein